MNSDQILYLNPVGTSSFNRSFFDFIQNVKSPVSKVSVASFNSQSMPPNLQHLSLDCYVQKDTLGALKYAEDHNYDALAIGCFADTGLKPCRELSSSVLVTSSCEASVYIASSLGNKIGIITGSYAWWDKVFKKNFVEMGLLHKVCSVKGIGNGEKELQEDPQTLPKIIAKAKQAVQEGAEVVVLGCTMQFGYYERVQEEIGVPVIDPVASLIKYTEMLISCKKNFGWSTSNVGSLEPPEKEDLKSWGLFSSEFIGNLIEDI
mmetsp:Transcript_15741/g.22804  ORF Transcript_15741/g.22804 Transcript_15741/m.22804 type:complete len:262 (+) Transcript_15741:13-798(+)